MPNSTKPNQSNLWPWKTSFQSFLVILLTTTTLITGISVTILNYKDGQGTIRNLSNQLFGEISTKIFSLIKNHLNKAEQLGKLNEKIIRQFIKGDADLRLYLYNSLVNFPNITYISVANNQGTLIGADHLDNRLRIRQWKQKKKGVSLLTEYKLIKNKLLASTKRTSNYDPRKRAWFKQSKKIGEAAWLNPFIWLPEKVPGITYAVPSFNSQNKIEKIITVDLQLDFISKAIKQFYKYKTGRIFITGGNGTLIAHNTISLNNSTQLSKVQDNNDEHTSVIFNLWKQNAMIDALTYTFNGNRFFLNHKEIKVSNTVSWHIFMSVAENEIMSFAIQSLYKSLALSCLILFLVIIACLLLGRYMARSFNNVFKEMESIFSFSLDQYAKTPSAIYEIDKISDYLLKIKTGFKSFKKYLSPILVKRYLLDGVEAKLGGEEKEVSVMFIDLENYTNLSTQISTEELIKFFNSFAKIITNNIDKFGGTVDKFIGDSVMAFWGGISSFDNHALLACKCALQCCNDVLDLPKNIKIRIGINTGKVIMGNFGHQERFSFTVLGDNVNQASRLENTNKIYKTGILISKTTYDQLKGALPTRKIDEVILKGHKGVTHIYQLLQDNDKWGKLKIGYYHAALSEYKMRNWQLAIEYLDEIIKLGPQDGPANVLKNRCQVYSKSPPPKDWDGTFEITTK